SAGGGDLRGDANGLLAALESRRHPMGGCVELGDHPFQANAHMHLLECALAWEELERGNCWSALPDELVELSLAKFVDSQSGYLREFFDDQWEPAAGDDGRWLEPGHQFEWAWLLERWGMARADARARRASRTLFGHGLRGVDPKRGVAM